VHTPISQVPCAHSSSKCPVSALCTHLQCALCTHPQRALCTNVPCAPMCPAHQRALRTNVPCTLISLLIAHLLCLTHISLKPNALQDTPSYFPYSTLSGPASLAAYFVAKYSLLSAPILIPARYTRPFQARQQLYLAPI